MGARAKFTQAELEAVRQGLAETEERQRRATEAWHPDPGTDAEAMNELLRDELDACKEEIARLRAQNKLLLALGEDRDVEPMGCGIYRVVPT